MQIGHHYYRGNHYVLLYSQHPDVCIAMHPDLRKNARHVAQASYFLQKQKSISSYMIPSNKFSLPLKLNPSRSLLHKPLSPIDRKSLMETFSVYVQLIHDAPDETLDVILRDIESYTRIYPKPKQKLSKIGCFKCQRIVPNTKEKVTGEAKVVTYGKQDYVPGCLIDLNLDFFLNSCSALLIPSKGRPLNKAYYDPFAGCNYCYADLNHIDTPL